MIGIQARVDHFMNSLKDQARFDEGECDLSVNLISPSDCLCISTDLLDTFPHLGSVIALYKTIEQIPNQNLHCCLIPILDNICANLSRSQNTYRYSSHVTHFALSLFIYAGQNAYRLVTLNIPGLLPSITTVRKLLANSSFRMHEAQYRFEEIAEHFSAINANLAFVAEDCTCVITKVICDSMSNCFVGFATPVEGGVPQCHHYQTDSFSELQRWFKEIQKSTSVNIHMVQPLPSDSSARISTPLLLSTYGDDGTFTAEDVLTSWLPLSSG